MAPPPADHWDSPAAQCRVSTRTERHLARTQRAHALRLAQSSRWPAGRACEPRRDDSAVAHPGARLSGWLAGPSSRHAC